MRYLCISAGRTKSISMRATIARVNVLSIMHRNLTCITDRTSDTVGAHTIRIARYRQGLAVYQQGLAVYPPGSHRRCWPARQWELQEVRVAGLHAARRRGGTSPGSSLRAWRRTALACAPVGTSGAPRPRLARGPLRSLRHSFSCSWPRQLYTQRSGTEGTRGTTRAPPHTGNNPPRDGAQTTRGPREGRGRDSQNKGTPPERQRRKEGGQRRDPPGTAMRPHGQVRSLPPLGKGAATPPHLGGDTGVERREAVRDVRVEGDQAIPCRAGASRAPVIEPPTP